jgi:hypothetical protein
MGVGGCQGWDATHYAFVHTYVFIEELKVPSSKEGQKQL